MPKKAPLTMTFRVFRALGWTTSTPCSTAAQLTTKGRATMLSSVVRAVTILAASPRPLRPVEVPFLGDTLQQKTGPAAADKSAGHDWDAIFATLDTPAPPAAGDLDEVQPSQKQEDRPGPGRTITSESKDDDPILKNLTGMGYSRGDALAALEKYDYNLERVRTLRQHWVDPARATTKANKCKAANYLASQS